MTRKAESLNKKSDQKHKLLFVDDDQNVLNSLKRLFRNEGYEITSASSAPEALTILEKKEFSLIISDQKMPEMGGAEFFEKVKQLWPSTVRIMLTGYADFNSAMDAINKGEVYRFILKPWDNDELKWIVYTGLMYYELVQENKRLLELTKEQNIKLSEINEKLTKEVESQSQGIRLTCKQMQDNYLKSLYYLIQIQESRVETKMGHAHAVMDLAAKICNELTLTQGETQNIKLAAYLHDIGELAVSESILNKPDKLTESEFQQVKKHPSHAAQILKPVLLPDQVIQYVEHHHERIDGGGYPENLKGDQISAGARIIAVADAFVTMTSKRSYREAYDTNQAVQELIKNSDKQFDSHVVQSLLSILARS